MSQEVPIGVPENDIRDDLLEIRVVLHLGPRLEEVAIADHALVCANGFISRWACALGDRKRALDLLKRDPSLLQSYSEDGFPALGLAVFFRHPDLARELIERGADVNAAARNPQRVAPVHSAATVQDHATMRLLLQRGADPNARQQLGFTPFHSAASRGDIEMAKLLVEHGADPHARTDDDKDAISIAQKYGKPAFAEWFQANFESG